MARRDLEAERGKCDGHALAGRDDLRAHVVEVLLILNGGGRGREAQHVAVVGVFDLHQLAHRLPGRPPQTRTESRERVGLAHRSRDDEVVFTTGELQTRAPFGEIDIRLIENERFLFERCSNSLWYAREESVRWGSSDSEGTQYPRVRQRMRAGSNLP